MEIFDYDKVLLLPRKCRVTSRSECDAAVELGGRSFRIPVVPANMKTVINQDICVWMAQNGYFYVMHRFDLDNVQFVRDMKARVAAHSAPRGGPRPRTFYMVWDRPLMTAGPDSYLSDLITLAGGSNVVNQGVSSYPTYSWEALLAADPDVILGPRNMAGALKALAHDYPRLRAVKENRVRVLPDDLVSRPGPRIVEAIDAVSAALKK